MGGTEAVAAPPPVQRGASAQPAAHHDVSPPLRAMGNSGTPGRAYPARPLPGHASTQADAARQAALGGGQAPTLGLGFDGMGNGFSGFTLDSAPPDPDGAVGPSNYVQIVNEGVTVFDKTGKVVFGPVATNTFWSGFGGGCQTNNDGDGTVEYDRQANRWVISQFSVSSTPYLDCIAVSQTGDPTGSYNRYSFSQPEFPDYPKVAVWPDAYYATYNMFSGNTFTGGRACALDRAKMLAGQAATQQCFDTGSTYGSLLPSDVSSSALPPTGAPNHLVALGADASSLAYWNFHVDFTTPANTTFTGPTALAVTTYSEACGGDNSCIPQSGTNTVLDSLGDRLMYRLSYRNFGDHEALVVDHSVTSGSTVGVRWYELRVGTGNTLSVFQQGTFAPDTTDRWLGSASIDKNGDIAIGYSTSSSSLHPGIRYTARTASDTAGTMGQGEGTVITGAGSQTQNLTRWGDYSSLSIDPSDDCTFWYVNEYIPANGSFNWRTRIATFNVAGCSGSTPPPSAPTNVAGSSSDGSVSLSWSAVSGATGYKVLRGTSPGGEGSSPVGTPAGTSFTDTGRTNGTTYYYKVVATNGAGDSSPSSEVSATPVATPAGLSATPSGTSVSLDWSDAAGATSYRVLRGTSPGGESSTPVGTPSGSSFNDTGLTAGNHYYYKVSAVNSTGSSPQSSETNALLVPPAPLNVHATPGDKTVSITWSAANGAASYKVLRHDSSTSTYSQIAAPSGTSFNDSGLTNGTQYSYEVKATNATGDGPVSAEVNATPSATPPPAAPTSLTATAGNGSVSLSWPASSGATSYHVYRGTSSGGESSLTTTSGTSLTDSGLTNGTTYYYKVAALGPGGEGAQSIEASATPRAPVQQQPPAQQPPPSGTTTTTTTTSVPPIPLPPQLILPAADTAAPVLSIAGAGRQKLADALKTGVSLDLGCSEACTDTVTLLLDFKTAHALHLAASRTVKVGGKGFSLSAGHRTVRVPFSSKAKKRLRHVRKVTVTVQVAGRDQSGNKASKTKRLALR